MFWKKLLNQINASRRGRFWNEWLKKAIYRRWILVGTGLVPCKFQISRGCSWWRGSFQKQKYLESLSNPSVSESKFDRENKKTVGRVVSLSVAFQASGFAGLKYSAHTLRFESALMAGKVFHGDFMGPNGIKNDCKFMPCFKETSTKIGKNKKSRGICFDFGLSID